MFKMTIPNQHGQLTQQGLLALFARLRATDSGLEKETCTFGHLWSFHSEEPWKWVASESSLGHSSCEGQHGQAAVLQLGQAHLLLSFLIAGEQAGEAIIPSHLDGVPLKDLLGAAELKDAHPEKDLSIHTRGTQESIMSID